MIDLVWEQSYEDVDTTEVAQISTFHLAKWVDRKYCAARRIESDISVRNEISNVEFYLNIAEIGKSSGSEMEKNAVSETPTFEILPQVEDSNLGPQIGSTTQIRSRNINHN